MQTRLTNLILWQIHQGLYLTNTASVYIYYGTDENPMDHEGNIIGTFMNHDKRLALETHCKETIAPLIAKSLNNTDYKYLSVDYTNMAPHPHLVISRKDKNEMTENDIAALKNHLNTTIVNINQKACPQRINQNNNASRYGRLYKKPNFVYPEKDTDENDLPSNKRFV